MQTERREYEKANGTNRPAERLVKLPGEARHVRRSDRAKVIANRIALAKVDREIKRLSGG